MNKVLQKDLDSDAIGNNELKLDKFSWLSVANGKLKITEDAWKSLSVVFPNHMVMDTGIRLGDDSGLREYTP